MTGFTALVLAGQRPGETDPAAAYAGVAHKALIELEGRTLLARVISALDDAGAGRIAVACDHPQVIAEVDRLGRGADRQPTAGGPSQSVADAAEVLGTPLLITTADHALLRGEWVARFLADIPPDTDVAVLLAPEADVRAAAPNTKRTYLKFRDGRYSGCNLFLLKTPQALKVVEVWRRVEAHRKQPWKIALMLGPVSLIAYALGLLTLDATVARLGRLAGVKAVAVRTPYGLAAVDVDKPADLDLVRDLLG